MLMLMTIVMNNTMLMTIARKTLDRQLDYLITIKVNPWEGQTLIGHSPRGLISLSTKQVFKG
jgi:hypothetical protein